MEDYKEDGIANILFDCILIGIVIGWIIVIGVVAIQGA